MQFVSALALPAIALVFAVAFFYLWCKDRSRGYLFGFGLGFLTLFLIMTVVFVDPSISTSPNITLVHALSCVSVIAIVWGATSRLHQKAPLGAMCFLSLVSCALLYFVLIEGEPSVGVLIQNETSGLLFGIGALSLWTARSNDVLDRVIVWTMSLLAGFSLLRPLLVLYLDIEVGVLVEDRIALSAVSVLVLTVCTAILGIAFVVLAVREALQIRHGATRTDPVSGFLDQRNFEHACEAALASAHRLNMPVSLAILQLDWFKRVMEKWGPGSSDMVLREISDRVRAWQRDSDIVGRIGEDKIAVLFVGVGARSAQKIVGNLRNDVDEACNDRMSGLLKFTLTSSISEAANGSSLRRLLREALIPLAKSHSLGASVSFVNGAELDHFGLSSTQDGTFVSHG